MPNKLSAALKSSMPLFQDITHSPETKTLETQTVVAAQIKPTPFIQSVRSPSSTHKSPLYTTNTVPTQSATKYLQLPHNQRRTKIPSLTPRIEL
jgi:hypothetical protein